MAGFRRLGIACRFLGMAPCANLSSLKSRSIRLMAWSTTRCSKSGRRMARGLGIMLQTSRTCCTEWRETPCTAGRVGWNQGRLRALAANRPAHAGKQQKSAVQHPRDPYCAGGAWWLRAMAATKAVGSLGIAGRNARRLRARILNRTNALVLGRTGRRTCSSLPTTSLGRRRPVCWPAPECSRATACGRRGSSSQAGLSPHFLPFCKRKVSCCWPSGSFPDSRRG